jgi:hypothetical protein
MGRAGWVGGKGRDGRRGRGRERLACLPTFLGVAPPLILFPPSHKALPRPKSADLHKPRSSSWSGLHRGPVFGPLDRLASAALGYFTPFHRKQRTTFKLRVLGKFVRVTSVQCSAASSACIVYSCSFYKHI